MFLINKNLFKVNSIIKGINFTVVCLQLIGNFMEVIIFIGKIKVIIEDSK